MSNSSLFSDFEAVDKAQWLEKVNKDLKGKAMETLNWVIREDFEITPFFHADDLKGKKGAILDANRAMNEWAIAETFEWEPKVTKVTNAAILDALTNGVEAIGIQLTHLPSLEEIDQLLANVVPAYIQINWIVNSNALSVAEVSARLSEWAMGRSVVLQGSLRVGFALSAEEQCGLLRDGGEGAFRGVTIGNVKGYLGEEQADAELAGLILEAEQVLALAVEKGKKVEEVMEQMQFALWIGKSYFLSLAKIRALKILWKNILHAYAAPTISPYIEAQIAPQSLSTDQHDNMIQSTTQAMSAVLAGVNCLYLPPANSTTESATPFTRRIARNVQHILKMESYLDRVVDPAAGSYYIESLTRQLAERAWQRFLTNKGK